LAQTAVAIDILGTGALQATRNGTGLYLSVGLVVWSDRAHLRLVMTDLAVGLVLKKRWTSHRVAFMKGESQRMNAFLVMLIVVGVWLLLQIVILPRMGVAT
jgi:hypothetical protein